MFGPNTPAPYARVRESPPPMMDHLDLSDVEPSNQGEVVALELSWAKGSLDGYLDRLLPFLTRHREEILLLAGGAQALAPDILASAKRVVARAGCVHLRSEMHDQIKQIRDEIWIRGERGDYDRDHITQEWTSLHAANWRRWRLKEYAFVIDRSAEQIVARIVG